MKNRIIIAFVSAGILGSLTSGCNTTAKVAESTVTFEQSGPYKGDEDVFARPSGEVLKGGVNGDSGGTLHMLVGPAAKAFNERERVSVRGGASIHTVAWDPETLGDTQFFRTFSRYGAPGLLESKSLKDWKFHRVDYLGKNSRSFLATNQKDAALVQTLEKNGRILLVSAGQKDSTKDFELGEEFGKAGPMSPSGVLNAEGDLHLAAAVQTETPGEYKIVYSLIQDSGSTQTQEFPGKRAYLRSDSQALYLAVLKPQGRASTLTLRKSMDEGKNWQIVSSRPYEGLTNEFDFLVNDKCQLLAWMNGQNVNLSYSLDNGSSWTEAEAVGEKCAKYDAFLSTSTVGVSELGSKGVEIYKGTL